MEKTVRFSLACVVRLQEMDVIIRTLRVKSCRRTVLQSVAELLKAGVADESVAEALVQTVSLIDM